MPRGLLDVRNGFDVRLVGNADVAKSLGLESNIRVADLDVGEEFQEGPLSLLDSAADLQMPTLVETATPSTFGIAEEDMLGILATHEPAPARHVSLFGDNVTDSGQAVATNRSTFEGEATHEVWQAIAVGVPGGAPELLVRREPPSAKFTKIDVRPSAQVSMLEYVRRHVRLSPMERICFGFAFFTNSLGGHARTFSIGNYQSLGEHYLALGKGLTFYTAGSPTESIPTPQSDEANLKAVAAFSEAIYVIENNGSLRYELRDLLIQLHQKRLEARQALSFYPPILNGQIDVDAAAVMDLQEEARIAREESGGFRF